MQISIQTSPHYSETLGDEEIAAILDTASEVSAMIRVGLALATAQSAIGLIPETVGADSGDWRIRTYLYAKQETI